MKVLKFGGTSVGSVESILNLKNIVESNNEKCIVVVSALGGLTDKLINTAKLAAAGDESYKKEIVAIVDRHHQMIESIIHDSEKKAALLKVIDALLDELASNYNGIYAFREIPDSVLNKVVAYGERMSSHIVATLIDDARWYDSLVFIKTKFKYGRNLYSNTMSAPLIHEAFNSFVSGKDTHKVCVAGGFISTDANTGKICNLGRGGSDYTAAILAATLNANSLEIWTDVSGFMTADPRVISKAYPIKNLTYVEATELCNFGAKVVYPPTIYPVCQKHIPIYIKNTFHPEDKGTKISDANEDITGHDIKGISSLKGTSLITVSGVSMVGLIGLCQRVFAALASKNINVILVSQASSECTITIGVSEEDSDKAQNVLNEEFAKEISLGSMNEVIVERDLATVAIVGENMKQSPGISGKLFSTLGKNGINIVASAQGASETNISFVVKNDYLRKTLNVIHDSFFLSEYQVLNLFICGVGNIGSNLIEQIRTQAERLKKERNLKLNVVGIANSKKAIFERSGINLDNYREMLNSADGCDATKLLKIILEMNIYNSVFVDCTASKEVADIYQPLLNNNISVVAANKTAASSPYENYLKLKKTAVKKGVHFLFETNVGAGLPIIGTINDLIDSGDKIIKIEAVLSGTLNYIFNSLSANIALSEAIRKAKDLGYTEPDPRIDLSGSDVVKKMIILAREAGYQIEMDDVDRQLFIPEEFFKGSIEEFWNKIPELDAEFETNRKNLESEGKKWRFVGTVDQGKAKVSLVAVDKSSEFYALEGSNNIILLTTDRYKDYPMTIKGYGAGASVTAAGVFANILSIGRGNK